MVCLFVGWLVVTLSGWFDGWLVNVCVCLCACVRLRLLCMCVYVLAAYVFVSWGGSLVGWFVCVCCLMA